MEKEITTKDLLKEIKEQSIDNLSIETFKKLQKLSEQKGGINSLEIQRQSFIRLANMAKRFNIYKKNPFILINNINSDDSELENNIENEMLVLEKDIPRCIYNQFIKNKNENQIYNLNLELLENKMKIFLKDNKNYSYYQGVLDVAVYFFLLYKKQTNKSIEIFQYYLEIYLRDYTTTIQINGDIFQNTVIVLSDFINLINPNIGKFFLEDNVSLCVCLSWIITSFCHDISKFKIIQRIMDYIFFHEPCVIFIMVSFIIIDILDNIIKKGIELNNEIILPSLSQFKVELIDFDDIIFRTQNFFEENEKEIRKIQIKNSKLLFLIGNINFKGSETIVNLPILKDKLLNNNVFINNNKNDLIKHYKNIYTGTSLVLLICIILFLLKKN